MSTKPAPKKKKQAAKTKKKLPKSPKIAGLSILGVPKTPGKLAPVKVAPGSLVLQTADPLLSVTVQMDGPMKGDGGFGGWEFEDTPREVQRIHWKGADGVSMSGTVVIHNELGGSIEQRIAAFLRMGGRPPGKSEPPAIRITGNIEYPKNLWVMATRPEPTREVWSASYRTSASFNVTFYAYNLPKLLGVTSNDPYGLNRLKKGKQLLGNVRSTGGTDGDGNLS